MTDTQPFKWINDHYKLNACFNREITYYGRKGIIVQDMGNYIGVCFDDNKRTIVLPLHPTDGVEYLGIGVPRKLTASQKRYMDYREVADCFNGFKHYLNYLTFKKNDYRY